MSSTTTKKLLCFIGFLLSFSTYSQSSTATYSSGAIPFSFNAYDASCNGPVSPLVVNIPAGAMVTSVDITYDVLAANGGWISDQRTAVHCQETGNTEATANVATNSGGTQNYNRTGVNIANGISATGVLTFDMRAWRTYGGSTCETSYQNVVNNSWSIIVYYTITAPMSYTSSTTTTASIADVSSCTGTAEILGVEVVTTGGSSAIDVTSLTINTTGTTTLADVDNINIYYTGTSSTFDATNLFGTATSAGSVVVNGTQTLSTGTNYFWVVYDLSPPLTLGNVLDGSCTNVTVGAANYTPTVTSPAGSRTVGACISSPGGVPNVETWFDAGNGPVGSPVTQWNNLGVNTNITSLTSPNGGTLSSAMIRSNYNDVVTTAGGYNGTFHAEVSNRNQLISGDEVTMYVVYFGNSAPDLAFEFHGSIQTNPSSNGADQWLTWGFRHGGLGVLYSNGSGGYNYDNTAMAGLSKNAVFAGLHGTSNSGGGNTVSGNDVSYPNIGAFMTGSNFMELSIGYWPGYGMSRGVMEAILWDDDLSATSRSAVESYLALKYGITLGVNGTSENYISPTSNAVIWDVAANTGFNSDIAGISRSDLSGLDQRKSHSTNGLVANTYSDVLTVANGTSFTSPAAFVRDDSHLIWGHNNGSLLNTGVLVNYPTDNGETIETIFLREWKAQELGTLGTVTLEFDLSTVAGAGGVVGANDLADVRLLIDEDGDYSTGATSIAPTSFNNGTGIVYFQHDFEIGTGNALDQNLGFFFTLGSTNFTAAPLPVELSSYEIETQGCSNLLTWTTASESHNSHFTIERSMDMTNWSYVGEVKGAGNSIGELAYSYRDNDFDQNGVQYYRLTQHDFDGGTEMVGIQAVNSFCEDNVEPIIYPNPTSNQLKVQSTVNGSATVIDVNGRILVQEEVVVGLTPLDVNRLAQGTYILKLQMANGKTYTKPFVKE